MKNVFLTMLISILIPISSWGTATYAPSSDGVGGSKEIAEYQAQIAKAQAEEAKILAVEAAATAAAANPTTAASATACKAGLKKLTLTMKSCDASFSRAGAGCITSWSPHIKTAMATIGILIPLIKTASSASNACSSFNKALNVANIAVTAYNAECTALMISCKSTCASVSEAATTAAAACKGVPGAPAAINPPEIYATHTGSCDKFKWNLAAGGAGLISIVTSMSEAKSCKDKTTNDCNANPSASGCNSVAAVDCTNSANASNIQCICKVKPNTPGCATAVGFNEGSGLPSTISATTSNANGLSTKASNFNSENGSDTTNGSVGVGTASKVTGGGGGGPSGGSDGNGGFAFGNSPKAAVQAKEKPLNTNILSGTDGGGGGGGGSSGYDTDSGASNSAYRNFMPGGANDPSRNVASQNSFANGEVTGMGGKSNWEKIKESYNSNRSSLLPGQ